MKNFKIFATVILTFIITTNIRHAINYYHIDHISLPDQFFLQSIDEKIVNNKRRGSQNITISSSIKLSPKRLSESSKSKLLFITNRDSYNSVW